MSLYEASLIEPAAEMRQVQQKLSIEQRALRVIRLEANSAAQDRHDGDARMKRETEIGQRMLQDLKEMAAEHGVELPEKIGGTGGWLKSGMLPLLHAEWALYKARTGWSNSRFTELFMHGHDPEGAKRSLNRERDRMRGRPTTSTWRTKIADIIQSTPNDSDALLKIRKLFNV